jgi:small subunit ribosomal protein S6
MKQYELMFIVDPSAEETVDDVKKRIEGIITGREGQVVSLDKLGKKRLAFPIARQQYGVYFLLNFRGDTRIVQALDYFLRLNPSVIRHMIISFSDKMLHLKGETEKVQREEAERMRLGGRPMAAAESEATPVVTAEAVAVEATAAVTTEAAVVVVAEVAAVGEEPKSAVIVVAEVATAGEEPKSASVELIATLNSEVNDG